LLPKPQNPRMTKFLFDLKKSEFIKDILIQLVNFSI